MTSTERLATVALNVAAFLIGVGLFALFAFACYDLGHRLAPTWFIR